MKIKVRFFAALREAAGCEALDVSVPRGDVIDLLDALRVRLDSAAFEALRAPNVRIAVNQEFIEGRCALGDGDEVAFMPPITGG